MSDTVPDDLIEVILPRDDVGFTGVFRGGEERPSMDLTGSGKQTASGDDATPGDRAKSGARFDYAAKCRGRVALRSVDGCGLTGPGICASVAAEDDNSQSWSYQVACPVAGRQVRGRCSSQSASVSEMLFWLQQFGCPGHVPEAGGGAKDR